MTRRRGAGDRLRGVVFGAVAVLVAFGLVLDACGAGSSASSPSIPPPSPSLPASPVVGVIVAVDASSLSDVRGFTLLTPSGQQIVFTLGILENPTEFPPGHLKEHQATSVPVRVYFRIENGVPTVYRLGDASQGGPAAT